MNYYQACAFIDRWGEKPGEFFVIMLDRNTGVHSLSRDPGGPAETTALAAELTYPEGEASPFYSVGSLVRKS